MKDKIGEAMDRKENSIKKFVDQKERGMIYFASLRSAGEFMTVMYENYKADSDLGDLNEEAYHAKFWEQQKRFYQEIMEDPQR